MCGAGFRHCGGDQRALRSPSGLLRLPHLSILAVIAAFLVSTPFVLLSNDKNQETWECSAKVSKGRPQTSFVFMPFGRVRRRETLCNKKNQVTSKAKITKKSEKKAACLRAFAKTDGFQSQNQDKKITPAPRAAAHSHNPAAPTACPPCRNDRSCSSHGKSGGAGSGAE